MGDDVGRPPPGSGPAAAEKELAKIIADNKREVMVVAKTIATITGTLKLFNKFKMMR